MDQAAPKGNANLPLKSRKRLIRGSVALLFVCLLGVGLRLAVRRSQRLHQMQTDPEVATVWLLEVTHGPNHTLTRGSTVQRWANAHGIHVLGDYQVLTSSFNGEPNGIEFWFDYDSHTSVKELECHRVGPTAFVDDLGQIYHGFLDFQGKTVGVYLPGYDHAARRLTCNVHWIPRRPAAPFPVSRPMTFTVPLPSALRTLPPASVLPSGAVSVTKNGITVTLSDVRLSPARLRTLYQGQRDLTFRLDIRGGQIADDNIDVTDQQRFASPLSSNPTVFTGRIGRIQRQLSISRQGNSVMIRSAPPLSANFTITDPYGTALLPGTASVLMPQAKQWAGQNSPPVWVAPVTGAGRGTDCVRMQFHVQPPSRSPEALPPAPVAFDIPIRVSPDPAP